MRNIVITILGLLLSAHLYGQQAQEADAKRRIDITGMTVSPGGDMVNIGFTVHAGEKAARSREMITVTPVAVSEGKRCELTPLSVRGRKSHISQKRRAYAAGNRLDEDGTIFVRNGQTIGYEASVPASFFGTDGKLLFESKVAVCCSEGVYTLAALDGLVSRHEEEVLLTPAAKAELPHKTTGERIAEDFPFVAPVPPAGVRFTDELFERSMTIYYGLNSYEIKYDYRDNARVLSQILASIDIISKSVDCRVSNVLIAGFASPEGSSEGNRILAERRALALRDLIKENTGLTDSHFNLHNGEADWIGLRRMAAASDMQYRDEVIDIIDNTPVWDAGAGTGRMKRIMSLDNGSVYRYMLREFFPELRNAAYLIVYFENK